MKSIRGAAVPGIWPAAVLMATLAATTACAADFPDISSVEPDLTVPAMTTGTPAAGRRVKQVIPEYRRTDAHHALYLPVDWQPGRRYPVIVEYAGNGPYKNKFGDISTGLVEGSRLGYGMTAGKAFIWLCLPYLNDAGNANVTQWWGNRPTLRVEPTLAYCKKAVPWICQHYGGDPEAVILVGFSRGAIACNYVGLHDDEIAKLWRAFVPYSHYDGVRKWGYPKAERADATERLKRLRGRPQFICHEGNAVSATRDFIQTTGVKAPLTFMSTGFRNHNDAWILRPSPVRKALRDWLADVLRPKTAP